MAPVIGQLGLLLALAVAVYSAAAAVLGARRVRPALVASARNGIVAVAALVTLASAALLYALGTHDFSVKYVAEQTSRDMPWYITLAAFYSSQAGSLLFWCWTLALLAVAAVVHHERRHPQLLPYVVAALAGVEAFFAYLLVALSDPFARLSPIPADGRGLNPLLYDTGMLIHPPFQLMGYMATSVPFAFVVAALATGRLDTEWIVAVRRWMLLAWALLGSGLLLGAWWAYHTLGWGGYWGWDPVENVALLPWLTVTAYLHSAMVQERRGMLKVWNVSLVLASFALSIFGTLIVRGGLLSSVHAFGQSAIGPAFFAFLAVVIAGSAALLFARLPRLRDEGGGSGGVFEATLSRDTTFLLNNLLLVAITAATLWGTIYPLISETVRGVKVAVGPPFYQQVNGPLLLALLVLMAVCTLLPWRRATPEALYRALRWPAAAAVVVCAATFLAGARSVTAQLGIAACVLAAGTTAVEYVRGVQARRRSTHEAPLPALGRLVARGRRRYGGYLVHLAVICLGVGVVGSLWFQSATEATVAAGEQFNTGRYTFTYRGLEETQAPGIQTVAGKLEVTGPGIPASAPLQLQPGKRFHRNWEQQPSSQVAIHTVWPWMEDIYVVMAAWDDAGRVTFQSFVNPMVPLLWVGLVVFWGAALVVLWPERRHRASRAVTVPNALERLGRPAGLAVLGTALGVAVVAGVVVSGQGLRSGRAVAGTASLAAGQASEAGAALAAQQPRIRQLEAAVAADPNAAGALFDLGETYMEAGQWQQAVTWFGRLLQLDPARVPATVDLLHAETDVGIAYMNLDLPDRAEPLLLDVIGRQPQNPQVHYSLGFLYAGGSKPNVTEAVKHWQQVVQLAPDSEWAKAARTHLDTLQGQTQTQAQGGMP